MEIQLAKTMQQSPPTNAAEIGANEKKRHLAAIARTQCARSQSELRACVCVNGGRCGDGSPACLRREVVHADPLVLRGGRGAHRSSCCCCAETFALSHENELLRPRPATNARGKHRQFMQKCVCRDEFIFEGTFGQAATVSRRQSQDPGPDRARGGAGPGRVVMGWSGAPFPPLKAAQGQRVVEKGADVASPHSCHVRGCLLRDSVTSHDRISQHASHGFHPLAVFN